LSCVGTTIDANAPATIIGSRSDIAVFPRASYDRAVFESTEFGDAFVVLTKDSRFAHALVDQRLMAWLLDLPPGLVIEVAGGWCLISGEVRHSHGMTLLIETLSGFVDQIPSVVSSLFPPTHEQSRVSS